jgi:DHA2 family methylenomycin A resistance protein-like MFS transporter
MRFTLLAMTLGFAVVQLDVSVVNVAVKPIGDDLGGDTAALQWIVNAYTIGFAGFILSAGALGDRVGARRVFVGGFCLFVAASAACGLAPGIGALVAARAVQGVGAAVLVPNSLILLNHTYHEQRARAVGIWAAGSAAALAAGPLVGGVLIALSGWRAIFFINLPLGLLAIWLTLRHTGETPRAGGRIDVPGQVLAVSGLAALAAAIISGGVWIPVAAVALGAFVLVEARVANPMLPLRLFRRRTFSAAASIGLTLNIAFYGLIFVLSLYFQRDQGRSALATGLAFAPMTAIVVATNVWAGGLAARFGPRAVVAGGGVLGAAACAALLVVSGLFAMLVPMVALGAAVGLVVPVMTSELLGSVERARSGIASGTLNTLRQTGSVIGVAIAGAVGLHASLGLGIALLLGVAGLARGMA